MALVTLHIMNTYQKTTVNINVLDMTYNYMWYLAELVTNYVCNAEPMKEAQTSDKGSAIVYHRKKHLLHIKYRCKSKIYILYKNKYWQGTTVDTKIKLT